MESDPVNGGLLVVFGTRAYSILFRSWRGGYHLEERAVILRNDFEGIITLISTSVNDTDRDPWSKRHIWTRILLPVLRPTACIRIRLRIPTCTRTTSTSALTRRPRPCRRGPPNCSTRAHRRGAGARRAVLGIQQALEEVLQHLVLRLSRRARRAPQDRRRWRARALAEAEAAKRAA